MLCILLTVSTSSFGASFPKELHELSGGHVGHGFVGLDAGGEGLFECGDEIGFRGFALLDFQGGIFLAEFDGTKQVLCVGHSPTIWPKLRTASVGLKL